jgi:hypothetical protein
MNLPYGKEQSGICIKERGRVSTRVQDVPGRIGGGVEFSGRVETCRSTRLPRRFVKIDLRKTKFLGARVPE